MSSTPPPPGVPLELVDACLDSVAGLLHDRPVQQLVAAKLLIETAMPDGEPSGLVHRAVTAVGSAGEQCRDVMWALTPPALRPDAVEDDIRDALARVGAAGQAVRVDLVLDDDVDLAVLELVVRAVHHLLAGVLVAGGQASAIHLSSDAESVQASVVVDAAVDGGPWGRLAAARLTSVGGRVERSAVDGGHRIEVSAPLPG